MNSKNFPTRGQVYSFEEVTNLDLRDSPCLEFILNGNQEYVQKSHMTEKEQIEALKETRWKYIRETYEWIPIFHSADPIEKLLPLLERTIHDEDYEPLTRILYSPKGSNRGGRLID